MVHSGASASIPTERGLLPCPFCGGKAKVNELRRGNYRREGDNYQAVCNKCRARGPLIQNHRHLAASAWNDCSRPTPTPSQAQDGYGRSECTKDPLDILIDDAFEKMGQQPADERLTPETDANRPDNGGSTQGNPND